jgi:2-oxoglutarate ferredoxin oxidoreductase subunit beta
VDKPLNPVMLALAAGATWVGRGFSSKPKEMTELIKQAISHRGFSFLQIYSPCVTFYDTYDHYKQVTKPLPETHDPSDKAAAMEFAMHPDNLFLGLYYQEERTTYDDAYSGIRQKATKGAYSLEKVMSKYKR